MRVGARYYDAQAGRFVTRDTLLSEHPYLYCEHEPVGSVDPSGHARLMRVGGLVPTHYYIDYPGGSIGFWPGSNPFMGPGRILSPDPEAPYGTPIQAIDDPAMDARLQMVGRIAPYLPAPTYSFPAYNCGSFAHDLWSLTRPPVPPAPEWPVLPMNPGVIRRPGHFDIYTRSPSAARLAFAPWEGTSLAVALAEHRAGRGSPDAAQ